MLTGQCQATEDEIKDAYKKLCRFFHPDKVKAIPVYQEQADTLYLQHNDPNNKKVAEARFQVIQTAYEGIVMMLFIEYGQLKDGIVLSDPIKRAIYDTYGEEGLNAKWEVGPKYKTSEEVRVKDDDE